jgi:hypothetical protein
MSAGNRPPMFTKTGSLCLPGTGSRCLPEPAPDVCREPIPYVYLEPVPDVYRETALCGSNNRLPISLVIGPLSTENRLQSTVQIRNLLNK